MKKSAYITIIVLLITLSSCNKLDVVGLVINRSNIEDRVKEWLSYNADNGEIIINDVADNYCFYSSSDTHYSTDIQAFSSDDRIYQYVTKNRNDSLAAFSIIAGDIVGVKGEDAFKNVVRAMSYHTDTQLEDKACFTVVGNHDIYFDCAEYYKKYFHTSTYTVKVVTTSGKQDLFIFLDSANGTHGSRQLSWLEEVLSRRNEYRYCIVVSHNWLFRTSYDPTTTPAANFPIEEQYAFMNMMSENNVDLVLMGHLHKREQRVIDGVSYVMSDNMNESEEEPTYLNVSCGEELTYRYEALFE